MPSPRGVGLMPVTRTYIGDEGNDAQAYVVAVLSVLETVEDVELHLGLGVAVQLQLLRQDSSLLSDELDVDGVDRLGDVDVGGHWEDVLDAGGSLINDF